MIRIYAQAMHLDTVKERLSRTIHSCMVDVLGLPEGKRAHRFIGLGKDNYYVPEGRSDQYTVIEVNMMAGRRPETRKSLIKALFERIENDVGIAPVDVEITITEQPPENWGFRGITGDEAELDYTLKV